MHESVITRKVNAMIELFDITLIATSEYPDVKAYSYTRDKIKHFVKLLTPYQGNEEGMLHSQRVDSIFQSFFSLKDKFDAFVKDSLQESRDWYKAALIVSEADGALDDETLAAHTVRECLKKGMSPWISACATNSVLEKDIVTLEQANSAYEALRKTGKIK